MKYFGYGIISIALFTGVYLTALDPVHIAWDRFIPTLLVGALGVWLVQKSNRAEQRRTAAASESTTVLRDSLDAVIANLAVMMEEKETIPVFEMRFEIDAKLRDDLQRFADHRGVLRTLHGLQAYAAVMTHFAAGERLINRVWSASADGYVDEVLACTHQAHAHFTEARTLLGKLLDRQD